MSKFVASSGERVAVEVPTRSPSNACIHILDEDGRLLLSVRIATHDDTDGSVVTRMVVEGMSALMLQDASQTQIENERVVFTRRQA